MLPNWTKNSEDTVRQNLLMGRRQHQATLTSHSTGPLRSAGQRSGKDCGSLVPFSGNRNPTQRLTLSLAEAGGSFLCWEHPSFSKERVSLSQFTREAEEGGMPWTQAGIPKEVQGISPHSLVRKLPFSLFQAEKGGVLSALVRVLSPKSSLCHQACAETASFQIHVSQLTTGKPHQPPTPSILCFPLVTKPQFYLGWQCAQFTDYISARCAV